MSISSELTLLANTKESIRTSINNKGGSVGASDTFASYATAIDNLPSGGSDSTLRDLIERDITSITIPSGTTRIGTSAFMGCTSLTSVTIPNSVTEIAYQAFYNTRITSINLPSGVTSIGIGAFANCVNTTSINLPSGVTSIGESTFETCRSLTSLILPSGVTSIGQKAFSGCTGLRYIVCLATTPPTLGGNNQYAYPFYSTGYGPIYVPAASVDTYKAASGWSTYASRIYPITQLATVDGNPVYNYDLGNTSSTTILSTEMAKLPTGTSIEFAEGITNMGGSISGYTTVTLPSTFTSFVDQEMIGSSVTTLTMKSTTPPAAERNKFGGSGLTAIYVPASAVDTYKADSGWSQFASIIQAIPAE